jgi:hypothetical protein
MSLYVERVSGQSKKHGMSKLHGERITGLESIAIMKLTTIMDTTNSKESSMSYKYWKAPFITHSWG